MAAGDDGETADELAADGEANDPAAGKATCDDAVGGFATEDGEVPDNVYAGMDLAQVCVAVTEEHVAVTWEAAHGIPDRYDGVDDSGELDNLYWATSACNDDGDGLFIIEARLRGDQWSTGLYSWATGDMQFHQLQAGRYERVGWALGAPLEGRQPAPGDRRGAGAGGSRGGQGCQG